MDFSPFYKHMSKHYQNQRDALEAQNAVLWEIALNLIHQIALSEYDGSGISSLKEVGKVEADRLMELLQPSANEQQLLQEARSKGIISK